MRTTINFGLFTGSNGGFEFLAILSTVEISQLGVLSLLFKLLRKQFFFKSQQNTAYCRANNRLWRALSISLRWFSERPLFQLARSMFLTFVSVSDWLPIRPRSEDSSPSLSAEEKKYVFAVAVDSPGVVTNGDGQVTATLHRHWERVTRELVFRKVGTGRFRDLSPLILGSSFSTWLGF